ncbi:MAG TPA: C4-dicarboxylate ABC transporter substrate-binding protein [Hyphomicrobiaceae bacterium]|nr:C4-dicarboxylate ABC transporter substrate-binding protein [Hyphomicrobiaceae bacterium]
MRSAFRPIYGLLALSLLALAGSAIAQSPTEVRRDAVTKEKINSWTIGLAAGRIEGTPLRLAAELAQALDNEDAMRVLPIVSRGPFDNMYDLLFLRGVDMAIVYADNLDHFRTKERVPGLLDRVNYIARLFPAEVHLVVRPEINSLKDLVGKTINVNTAGTAAAYSGPIIFQRLGLNVRLTNNPHRDALQEIRKSDKYAGLLFVTTKPVPPLAAPNWPEGFKLLPIEMTPALEEYYVPAYLEAAEYPKLIPAGQRVTTIAVPVVLAVYNWNVGKDRYRRMVRFVDYLFDRLPALQKEPNHPAWKQVNLAATVPGWKRYPAVQSKLDALKGGAPKR